MLPSTSSPQVTLQATSLRIPVELVEAILAELDFQTLKSFSSTSSMFISSCRKHLFRSVTLEAAEARLGTGSGRSHKRDRTLDFARLVKSCPKIASYVKTLRYVVSPGKRDEATEIVEALKMMRNVECFEIDMERNYSNSSGPRAHDTLFFSCTWAPRFPWECAVIDIIRGSKMKSLSLPSTAFTRTIKERNLENYEGSSVHIHPDEKCYSFIESVPGDTFSPKSLKLTGRSSIYEGPGYSVIFPLPKASIKFGLLEVLSVPVILKGEPGTQPERMARESLRMAVKYMIRQARGLKKLRMELEEHIPAAQACSGSLLDYLSSRSRKTISNVSYRIGQISLIGAQAITDPFQGLFSGDTLSILPALESLDIVISIYGGDSKWDFNAPSCFGERWGDLDHAFAQSKSQWKRVSLTWCCMENGFSKKLKEAARVGSIELNLNVELWKGARQMYADY
ncbi:hypothetical protein DFP72DRAFT_1072090 [Ephemerocybe angulata]|uniref:F-box domain-containing protein n=1 Tax=Ephemerocybe angulata TaxID=980116 RepID=A0A8H6M184_9AGAR|nr:hypothetical protein DFP72DRAFT_1072090 [Tulosesus angulatus]